MSVKMVETKKEKTRAAIKKSARKIFARCGFETANVSDIVNELGLAQGTFYYHFPDKKSALVEILDDFFGQVRELVAAWAETTDTSRDAVRQFAGRLTLVFYKNRELAHILMRESSSPDPEIRRKIREFYEFLYEKSQRGLELGMALGAVRPLDPKLAAIALVGQIQMTVFELVARGGKVELDHVVEELTALQNYGIRPRNDCPGKSLP